jgi:hypothetical protein
MRTVPSSTRLAAGGEEVVVEVADAGGGKVGAVVAGEEVDLVVEVENGVVDRRGGELDDLLAPAAAPAPAVGGEQRLQVEVAVGVAVAEVVRLVDEDDVHVFQAAQLELLLAEALLGDDAGGDGRFAAARPATWRAGRRGR